jgi:hypothetical protein
MTEKFKKIDKEYLLTDNTVNCYGFRLLTEGYQIDKYKKNPIGYHMHLRDDGVLVRWEDFRLEGNEVYAKPVINLSNERAQKTIDEIENGFLNGASVGHLVVLEYSDDPSLKLPGQTGPTVTKWFNRECSLVDIPGNFDSLALFDAQDNPINLADFTKTKLPIMNKPIITAAMLSALNLKADADDNLFAAAFNDLVAKANKFDSVTLELNNLKAQAETEKKRVNKEQVTTMLSAALNVDKKITKELHDKLAADYESNPEGLKTLLAAIPAYNPITTTLKDEDKNFGADLASKSYTELWQSGKLPDLKAKNPELYKKKFKEEFNVDPKM